MNLGKTWPALSFVPRRALEFMSAKLVLQVANLASLLIAPCDVIKSLQLRDEMAEGKSCFFFFATPCLP